MELRDQWKKGKFLARLNTQKEHGILPHKLTKKDISISFSRNRSLNEMI
jgi:hypothetical protein